MSRFENAFTRDELIELLYDSEAPRISTGTVRELCRALIAEIDNPKVWDGAPENAVIAQVHFYKAAKTYATPSAIPMVYTRELPKSRARELPKSRAREIAEEEARIWRDSMPSGSDPIADLIESAILKREKELEAGK